MGTALKVISFAYQNRSAIMRCYHHFIKHKVLFDDLIDMAEDHPDHPINRKKKEDQQKLIESYDAGG